MGTLAEESKWEPAIYQVETNTPVLGGLVEFSNGVPVGGFANVAPLQLANRSQFLMDKLFGIEMQAYDVSAKLSELEERASAHYGISGDTHTVATQYANGFMSAGDKTKLDNLATVAITGSYTDLSNKPPVYFTIRSTDFTAMVGYRYYITQNLAVTLPNPTTFGYVQGDYISMYKNPQSQVSITASGGRSIVTLVGTDTSITFDLDDEITIVFDGTNWRV